MTQYRSDSMYRNTKIVGNKFLDVYQSPVPDVADMELDEMVLAQKLLYSKKTTAGPTYPR